MIRRFVPWLVFLVSTFLVSGVARAETPTGRGSAVEVVPATGNRVPMVLVARDSVFSGEFDVRNVGTEPLIVSRVAVRTDDDDPRVPSKVDARFVEGGTSATIAAGASKRVLVTWAPDRELRMRQVLGHVIVSSNDPSRSDIAMGFTARARHPLGPLADHALSLLVLLPLLGALLVFVTRTVGPEGTRRARTIAIVTALTVLTVASAVLLTFHTGLGRADGNDGFQFVERVVWVRSLGVEYFVGLDGTSAPFVLLTAVTLVASVASVRSPRITPGFYGCFLLVCGLVMGLFVACDLVLLVACWQALLVPAYFLVAGWGGGRRSVAALKMFVTCFVASTVVAFGVFVLAKSSDPAYLVDGSRVDHTFAIPELARNAFAARTATVFGVSLAKIGTVSVLFGFLVAMGAFPFHPWLVDATVESESCASSLVAALLPKIGIYGIVRVAFTILPEGSRWAAAALVGLGAVTILHAAFAAIACDDLKRLVAYVGDASLGFCLLGLGSMTPQGVLGTMVLVVSHGLAMIMALSLVTALESRVGTRRVEDLGGIGADAPVLSGTLAVALTVLLGLPGLVGFWGVLLTVLGTVPAHRIPAVLALVGMVVLASAALFALQRTFLGTAHKSLRDRAILEPFGGKVPDLRREELLPLVPLLALVVTLGLYPAPLLALASSGVRDVSNGLVPPGPAQIAFAPSLEVAPPR